MKTLTYLITFCLLFSSGQVFSQLCFLSADVTDVSSCGEMDGVIDLNQSFGIPPFVYSWSGPNNFTSTIEDISNLATGIYTVTTTDANNLVCVESFIVDNSIFLCGAEVSGIDCIGSLAAIDLTCVGGAPPYSYEWNTGATTQDISDLTSGSYIVTITDANGCVNIDEFIVNPTNQSCDTVYVNPIQVTTGSQIQVDFVVENFQEILAIQYSMSFDPTILQFDSVGNFNPAITSITQNSFAAHPEAVVWSWFEPTLIPTLLSDGASLYSLFFTALSDEDSEVFINGVPTPVEASNSDFQLVHVSSSPATIIVDGNLLSGTVYKDDNGNCENDAETPLPFWPIHISDGTNTFNVITGADGQYSIVLSEGTYGINVTPINENWNLCNNDITVEVDDFTTQDFGATALVDCPVMEVDMAIPLLIRCFENEVYFSYCNYGTVTATAAFIEVELDPEMTFVNADIVPSSINGNLLTFEIGDVGIGQCGDFNMTVLLDDGCDSSALGQTHCTTATIFPNVSCEPADPLWDGSSLNITGNCDGNNVNFIIENVGAENMTQASSFIVIEDHVMGQSIPEDFILAVGETLVISKPANGSTYYMSVNQVANHPGQSNPSVAVEGCGSNAQGGVSQGIVTQYNQDDNDGFIDIECVQNVGSYDPNDKRAMLDGFGEENYIYTNTPMEYMIRFQNTGTFTAFNVVVEDELSPFFDITTLRPGASSHDYTFSITDERKMVFTFENINLPDSTADLSGSNGFVTYKVDQLLDNPDGTVLENTADIFFDFNEAIVTNTTVHTIGSDFISISSFVDNELGQENSISIFPNPATDKITFELEKISENLDLEVYDLTGRLIYNKAFSNEKIVLFKNDMEEGMYFYSILSKGEQVESGKFIFL